MMRPLHCLLVALWFRFHIELATCLLFGFRSSYLSPKCERHTDPLRMRRASSDEAHACLVYNFVVVWVVWNNLCFLVWLFAFTVMSSFWRYLFVGIALTTWLKSWPVGTDHCSICYCFQGNVSTYAFDLRHYLDTNLRAEKCVTAINIGLKTSNDLYTCLRRNTCQMRTLELHYCNE